MKVKLAIAYLESKLQGEESKDDARYLASHLLQKSFTWIKTWPDELLTLEQKEQLEKLLERRLSGEPIAYITGERDFWTLTLKTNPSTLIPRPETELLVEKAIEFLGNYPSKNAKVLDLGTGTGAIALAIASARPTDKIIACDFQAGAVELAKENAKLNNINNVTIIQSDWFSNMAEESFELIVSNPPYVEEGDPHLTQGDLVFEPNSALVAADQGLADIKIIISESTRFLVDGGQLMIEHGYQQAEQLKAIFIENGFSQIETYKDLAGLDRITKGVKI